MGCPASCVHFPFSASTQAGQLFFLWLARIPFSLSSSVIFFILFALVFFLFTLYFWNDFFLSFFLVFYLHFSNLFSSQLIFFLFYLIEVWLIYNVLISAVQRSDSYSHRVSFIVFSVTNYHRILKHKKFHCVPFHSFSLLPPWRQPLSWFLTLQIICNCCWTSQK